MGKKRDATWKEKRQGTESSETLTLRAFPSSLFLSILSIFQFFLINLT